MDRIDYQEWSLKTLERGYLPPGLLADPNVEKKAGDNELKRSAGSHYDDKQVVSVPLSLSQTALYQVLMSLVSTLDFFAVSEGAGTGPLERPESFRRTSRRIPQQGPSNAMSSFDHRYRSRWDGSTDHD